MFIAYLLVICKGILVAKFHDPLSTCSKKIALYVMKCHLVTFMEWLKSGLNKVKESLWYEESVKKNIFWMLPNLTIGRYQCILRHQNLSVYLYLLINIYSCESILLLKENSAIRYWKDDPEKFKGLISKVFLGNECNS